MPKNLLTLKEPRRESESASQSGKSDGPSFVGLFQQIEKALSAAHVLLITTMPRGSLQIAQPANAAGEIVHAYAKGAHLLDRVTWEAIKRGKPVRGIDSFEKGGFESSRYYREFLQPNHLKPVAAAPLSAPVLEGYPGALVVFRSESQPVFSDADLKKLAAYADQIDQTIAKARETRQAGLKNRSDGTRFDTLAPIRQYIFDAAVRPQLAKGDPGTLDDRVRKQMLDHARNRLEHVNGHQTAGDRLSLPDTRGDLWNFRVVVHRQYPALGDGPFVMFCLQPQCDEWGAVRPVDFSADRELSRLVPAMRFMESEFHRGPKLTEIANSVKLSPFHFHRRFTELLGITPKHFMLDCQIEKSKRELAAGEKTLTRIAKDCGFAHQSHFTSRFKQATGLTPTRWRRQVASAK